MKQGNDFVLMQEEIDDFVRVSPEFYPEPKRSSLRPPLTLNEKLSRSHINHPFLSLLFVVTTLSILLQGIKGNDPLANSKITVIKQRMN